ncbi:hypothetical protein F0237_24435 [Vibrio tubiashii]|uniref:Uncharacterized protein n=1 Tax=Vibrio tubiashii TaxID=29498 RepID=A0AAE5GV28_9VIBR|nr:hypothetical protein [Vibrio tubiashii]
MSTNSTTRATLKAMVHHHSHKQCRENEVYFNGINFPVNQLISIFVQMVKKNTASTNIPSIRWFYQRDGFIKVIMLQRPALLLPGKPLTLLLALPHTLHY